MKKVFAILIMVAMSMAAFLPVAVANGLRAIADPPYEGGATPGPAVVSGQLRHQLSGGGGGGPTNHPVKIAAIWETSYDAIDDDLTKHGTQVDPPMRYQGTTPVCFFVAVFDEDNDYASNINNINTVTIDLYHPLNAGNDNCIEPGDGSFKANIVLSALGNLEGREAFVAAHDAENTINHIIWYYNGFDYSSLYGQWNESHIVVYKACYYMYYHQPAGWYKVVATAVDLGATYDTQTNYWEYVEGIGYELDFDTVNWETLTNVNQWYWVDGDWNFGEGTPTIRNIGNWDVVIGVKFSNWNFGTSQHPDGTHPDAMFDVRIGDKNSYAPKYNKSWYENNSIPMWPNNDYIYYPMPIDNKIDNDSPYVGPRDNVLLLCNTTKINFGIYVYKFTNGQGDYSGNILMYALPPNYHSDPLPVTWP